MKKNYLALLSHFLGKGGTLLAAFLATPFYIQWLGIEAFGLIGFYLTVTSLSLLFDFGIGDTYCRQAALLFSPQEKEISPSPLPALEIIYWSIGAALALIFYCSAPFIGTKFFSPSDHFPPERITRLMHYICFSLFFLWPFQLYAKGLQGCGKHRTLNVIYLLGALNRYGGALGALLFFSTTLETFFLWQIFAASIQSLCGFFYIRKVLKPFNLTLSFSALKNVYKFSAALCGINITSLLLMHVDRVLVAKYFSLKILGIYSLCATLSSSLYYLLHPLLAVYYPLFVQMRGDFGTLRKIYFSASKQLLLLITPCALLLIFFNRPLVYLWTQDREQNTSLLIALMTSGVFLNSFLQMNFFLQIAREKTGPLLIQNLFYTASLVPLFFLFAKRPSLVTLASFYLAINLGYLIKMHRQVLGWDLRVCEHSLSEGRRV